MLEQGTEREQFKFNSWPTVGTDGSLCVCLHEGASQIANGKLRRFNWPESKQAAVGAVCPPVPHLASPSLPLSSRLTLTRKMNGFPE